MAQAVKLSIVKEETRSVLRLEVLDQDLVGKKVDVRLLRIAKVKRSKGIDKTDILHSWNTILSAGAQDFNLISKAEKLFHYQGDELDLSLQAKIEIDDGVLFDTKVEMDASSLSRLPPRTKPRLPGKQVHSPSDSFRFWANMRAIPNQARAIVLWLIVLGLPVIALNSILGIHDQFVPEARTFFYDHTDSDGGGESPLMKALAGSGALGAVLWMAVRRQLKKYMRFEGRWSALPLLRRGVTVPASSLVSGDARVPLDRAMFRVVAYTREHGQYEDEEKDGDKTRKVIRDFTNDAGGIVLYQQPIVFLAAGKELASSLAGEVDFTPVFDALHPPIRIQSSHGLSLCLEAQLIHPDFVDQDDEHSDLRVDPDDFFAETLPET